MRAFWAVALVTGVALVAWASQVRAAVPQGLPQPAERFEVVPSEHPRVRMRAPATAKVRDAVIIQSSGVSEAVRQGFIRAALCGLVSLFGMIFIGSRLYGRRHGKVAM